MKKIFSILAAGIILASSSCQKNFIDLTPLDTYTTAAYFKQPSDFKAYATSFYGQLMGWNCPLGSVYDYLDCASDISANFTFSSDVGRGTMAVGNDGRWGGLYSSIRSNNNLLQYASTYTGTGDISQYVGEAYFFRAYNYFYLLKIFGGVPIVTTPVDINTPVVFGPRNSRYQVVDQIMADLDNAISHLPVEGSIPSTDKGRISKWAAEAFKAEVELYEATWRKYNGTSTDFAGSAGPASNQINTFLADAVSKTYDVMQNGGYSLWNYNSNAAMPNLSSRYLFNLDDAGSNPAGLTKASNNEFILYGVYDYNYRRSGINLSFTSGGFKPSRKFIDMVLCTDGLPPEKSPLFKGYHHPADEYQNRDYRLAAYTGNAPANGMLVLDNYYNPGYGNLKYGTYNYPNYRSDGQESQNFPIIRLPLVYLTYAEALYELNGAITDGQLNASINLIRARAGVAALTNGLATANGLDMLNEIRRERCVELYLEGFRFDDLKRWGIAEAALNPSRCGMVVGNGSDYATEFKTTAGAPTSQYKQNVYIWGEEVVNTAVGPLKCVVMDGSSNHSFAKKNYLWPIPLDQINLNNKLVQNPGY